ncbi:MAG: hypothetical protein GXO73_12485, partial [Calditrichaeota bacterium]|nr:hypothetical protein [Calditrichota bacterium]
MFWSNVFVWDGKGDALDKLVDAVYRPTLQVLREDRKRQATVAITSELLQKLHQKATRDILLELRDLAVLQQIDFATVEQSDLPPAELESYLNRERTTLLE